MTTLTKYERYLTLRALAETPEKRRAREEAARILVMAGEWERRDVESAQREAPALEVEVCR